ncbi:MAG: sigma-70 family RNA polymerase sigma factor [Planctomycetota bacterium]
MAGTGKVDSDEILRASSGDAGAVDRVLARWSPAVEGYLRRHAGRRVLAAESAADLAQSVCREALERLGRGDLEYRGEDALRRWLFGAADLKVKNRLRYYGAQKRGEGAAALDADVWLNAAKASDPSPSGAAALGEDREAFRRALENLDPRQQEAIELFHLQGLDHAEVARRLDITTSHSRTLVARALAKLARHLRAGD